jgi:hypothetical protein
LPSENALRNIAHASERDFPAGFRVFSSAVVQVSQGEG